MCDTHLQRRIGETKGIVHSDSYFESKRGLYVIRTARLHSTGYMDKNVTGNHSFRIELKKYELSFLPHNGNTALEGRIQLILLLGALHYLKLDRYW